MPTNIEVQFNFKCDVKQILQTKSIDLGILECAQVFGSMLVFKHKVMRKLCYLRQIKTVVLVFTFQRLFEEEFKYAVNMLVNKPSLTVEVKHRHH